MLVQVVVLLINTDIPIVEAEYLILLKKMKVSTMIFKKYSGVLEPAYLSKGLFLMSLVDLMKTTLHTWKRSIYAGEPKTKDTKLNSLVVQ